MMISIWVQDARAIIMDHEIHPNQLCTISSTSRTPTKYFSTAYLSEECIVVMANSTQLEFVALFYIVHLKLLFPNDLQNARCRHTKYVRANAALAVIGNGIRYQIVLYSIGNYNL